MLRAALFCWFTLCPVITLCAQPPAESHTAALSYSIAFTEADAHYANIQLTIPAQEQASIELMMPTWTPGSYLIREYARHVDGISAHDATDKPLAIEKIKKNRWRVDVTPGSHTRIDYRLYCREMSVRTNWIDHDMAILNGGATFLTPADNVERPHRVRFELPQHWSRSVTSLTPIEGLEHTYLARNLDELIDAPTICGNPIIQDFMAGGVPHAVANLGDFELWDTEKAAQDVQKIVEQQQQLWGQVPYERYKVLNVIAESGGGLEHDNSTLVMTSRWNFRDPEKYQDWLSLISHEFFHTWNVRRLRPANLARYDYEQENLTRSLWIAEGITSYYEDVILVRAGLIDRTSYLKRLSKQIQGLQTTPGRLVQSLSDSSFDAWIKYYRPDENSNNSRVSYYIKGCVVAFLLDARIREATSDAKSLDDVMRMLYSEHSNASGFTDEDFRRVASSVAGVDLSEWFELHINSAVELDYEPALKWFGLQFAGNKAADVPARNEPTLAAPNPAAPDPAATSSTTTSEAGKGTTPAETKTPPNQRLSKAWLGMKASETAGRVLVTGVTPGSPAQAAGLNLGDELIAFNQYRVSGGLWQTQLNQLGIGREIEVTIARRGEVRKLSATAIVELEANWNLKRVELKAEAAEPFDSRVSSWLGKLPESPSK